MATKTAACICGKQLIVGRQGDEFRGRLLCGKCYTMALFLDVLGALPAKGESVQGLVQVLVGEMEREAAENGD